MVCKGGVFSLLLMSCCLESSVSVFERHSNIHDGHGLASLIYSDKSGRRDSSVPGIAWLILMVVEAGALNAFTNLCSCVVALCYCSKIRFAMAQNMGQCLPHVATPAASTVPVAESLASIEWDAVQSCPVDEPPISKARKVTIPHEVVWRGYGNGHIEHFALVWFPQELVTVVAPDGVAECCFSGTFSQHKSVQA